MRRVGGKGWGKRGDNGAAVPQVAAHRPHGSWSNMGHQHYSTTQRYLHHKPRREDAARLAEAFGHQSGIRVDATEDKTEQDATPESG